MENSRTGGRGKQGNRGNRETRGTRQQGGKAGDRRTNKNRDRMGTGK